MAINETVLFTYLRRAPFGGRLTQDQVDGVALLIRTCAREGVTDLRHVANILAQVHHETGGRLTPVRETFATSDAQAIARLDAAYKAGRLKVSRPYWRDGFFGRGHIQITWRENYRKLGAALGVDLERNPSRALEPDISARVAVIGMRDGLFTGKKLSDYFNRTKNDPVGARRIVNGTDKASLIAGYHRNFHDALVKAETSTPLPTDVSPRMAEPDDVKPAESKTWWSTVLAYLSGLGLTGFGFLKDINNPFALAAIVFLVIAGAIVAWLIMTERLQLQRNPNNAQLDVKSTPMVDADSGDRDSGGSDLSLVGDDMEHFAAWDTGVPGGDSDGVRRVPVRTAKRPAASKTGTATARRTSGAKKARGGK